MKSVCIYCGSSPGVLPIYQTTATQVGTLLAQKGLRLVYGGGRKGLMGKVADGCLEAGGEVLGVTPEALVQAEQAHQNLTQLMIVPNMHQRKETMIAHSDGFIALPGGAGTLEELFEVFTWHQLEFHDKPCGILNVHGYYDSLLQFLQHAVSQGFIIKEHLESLIVDQEIGSLLDRMEAYQRSHPSKLHYFQNKP